MKLIAFRPTQLFIKLLVVITIITIFIKFDVGNLNISSEFLVSALVLVFIVAIIDFFQSRKKIEIIVKRSMPRQFSINRWHTVTLTIVNKSNRNISFICEQQVNDFFEKKQQHQPVSLLSGDKVVTQFHIKALKRGNEVLGDVELCITSPWLLWQSYWLFPKKTELKVYPDFQRISQQHSLKGVKNLSQIGLKKLKKRGDGIEFHQLREYRQGDSVKQIDWQATSKRQKLIAKDYQEERNQHIIVMLDAGVNMNIKTSFGTHFDAALNALLMLSHTVLKQGDLFSMQSFNKAERWLPAVKGAQNVTRVMNHFYDLEPDESASDYTQAVNHLLAKRSKRSLVLLVTTFNDQNFIDLIPAIKRLQQHHLVALINIENVALSECLNAEIENITDANKYCAAVELKNASLMQMKRLSKEGLICVETKPENLLPHVINTYLKVKSSGLL